MAPHESLKNLRVCVVDYGLFVDVALKLSESVGEVSYHNPGWRVYNPKSIEARIGDGFDQIKCLKHFWKAAHLFDLFVFTTVGMGDWQEELRRQGKLVWGAGKYEDMETYRIEFKELMRQLGMPTGDYTVVYGLDALREYLKEHPNVHVKINLYRGDTETFQSRNYNEIEPKLDYLDYYHGPFKNDVPFLVEQDIPNALETGGDHWVVNGKFPKLALQGVENKDRGYLITCIPYEDLCEPVKRVNAWLAPALKDYRGPLHHEIRVGPDEVPHLLDITARYGSPPTESMVEMIENLAEIMYYGAQGILVEPQPRAKYAAQAVILSENCKAWQLVAFPDSIKRWVKLYDHTRHAGKNYIVPMQHDLAEIGYVVGLGDTIKKAISQCKSHAELVQGSKINVETDALEDIVEEIKKGEDMGITFSDEPVPEKVDV